MLNNALDHLLGLPSAWDYSVVFAMTFLETAIFLGFVLPGETAVILGGVLAARGVLRPEFVFAFAAAGCVMGDFVGYMIGVRLGPRLLGRDWLFGLVKASALADVRAVFADNSGKALVLGRFTALLRAMTPAAAGVAGMPVLRFMAFDVVGGLAWAGMNTVIGYLAGNAWQVVAARFGHATIALAAVVIAMVAWLRLRRRLHYRTRLALGLSAAAAVTVLGFYSFVEVAQRWISESGLTSLDQSAVALARSLHSPWLAWPLSAAVVLGGVVWTSLVALGTTVFLLARHRVHEATSYAALVLSGSLTILALKEFFYLAESSHGLAFDHGWAFPNGSTFLAIVVYGLTARAAWVETRSSRVAWSVGAAALLIVVASATGHVYNGARWTTDVLAGSLLGCGWLAMGMGVLGWLGRQSEPPHSG